MNFREQISNMKLIAQTGAIFSMLAMSVSCSTINSATDYLKDQYHSARHFDTNKCDSYESTEISYCKKQKEKEIADYGGYTPNKCSGLKPITIGNDIVDYPKKACGRVLYEKKAADKVARYNQYKGRYEKLSAMQDSQDKLTNLSQLRDSVEALRSEDEQTRIELYFATDELNSKVDGYKNLQDACYGLSNKVTETYNKTLAANEKLQRDNAQLQEANRQKAYEQQSKLAQEKQQKLSLEAKQKNATRIQTARQSNPSGFSDCEKLAAELQQVGKQLQMVNTNVISEAKTKEAKEKIEKLTYRIDVINEKVTEKNCQQYY